MMPNVLRPLLGDGQGAEHLLQRLDALLGRERTVELELERLLRVTRCHHEENPRVELVLRRIEQEEVDRRGLGQVVPEGMRWRWRW